MRDRRFSPFCSCLQLCLVIVSLKVAVEFKQWLDQTVQPMEAVRPMEALVKCDATSCSHVFIPEFLQGIDAEGDMYQACVTPFRCTKCDDTVSVIEAPSRHLSVIGVNVDDMPLPQQVPTPLSLVNRPDFVGPDDDEIPETVLSVPNGPDVLGPEPDEIPETTLVHDLDAKTLTLGEVLYGESGHSRSAEAYLNDTSGSIQFQVGPDRILDGQLAEQVFCSNIECDVMFEVWRPETKHIVCPECFYT